MASRPALRRRRSRGVLRGIGIATYIEACGGNGPDTATISLDKDGTIHLHVGTQTTGQGHDTSFSQIVADHLSVPPEQVRMLQGDTAADRHRHRHRRFELDSGRRQFGRDGGGKARGSIEGCCRRRARSRAARSRIFRWRNSGGRHRSRHHRSRRSPRTRTCTADKLSAADAFVPKAPTYPNGTHVVEVEIDEATGLTDIVNYVIVDDFGVSLNPLLLEGQVHGGTVQGIGQALMENTVYDTDSGQLITASLMDYALPRAGDMPDFIFETRNVPCKANPLGVKGAGEAGAIGSCPAVMNAVVDALWRGHRVDHTRYAGDAGACLAGDPAAAHESCGIGLRITAS